MLEKCFEQPCPPLVETFSFDKSPCLYEPTTAAQDNKKRPPCPFRELCRDSSRSLIRLEKVYGSGIKVTLSEPSSSIIVRSEHQFNKSERRRLGLRKHIYELSSQHAHDNWRRHVGKRKFTVDGAFLDAFQFQLPGEQTPARRAALQRLQGTEFASRVQFRTALDGVLARDEPERIREWLTALAFGPLDCYQILPGDRFGHYVGFVDLRPNSSNSPLAMGILGMPRRYRHNSDVRIITGNYGKLFGGPSFASTVYSMHDGSEGGAQCAQACVIMALGFLGDRGARLSGNYTLTYLAKQRSKQSTQHQPGCPEEPDPEHLGNIPANSPLIRFSFESREGLDLQEIQKVLEQRNLGGRVFRKRNDAHHARMLARLIEAYVMARLPSILAVRSDIWWPWTTESNHHVVLVIGFRKPLSKSASKPVEELQNFSLITHDPGYLPFYEQPFSVSRAASAALGELKAVFVGTEAIQLHGQDCLDALVLRTNRQLTEPAFSEYFENRNGKDYRIDLIARDDLADRICHRSRSPRAVQRQLNQRLACGAFWCVTALENDVPVWTWIFDARRPLINPQSQGKFRSTAQIESATDGDYLHYDARGNAQFEKLG